MNRVGFTLIMSILIAAVAGTCFGSVLAEPKAPAVPLYAQTAHQPGFIVVLVRLTVFENGNARADAWVFVHDIFSGKSRLYYAARLFRELHGYRSYDPFTARFTTVDPIHAGLNWYAYCAGDPINSVDLWGLCPDDEYLKFATIPSMKYNDLNNIPAWAVPLAIIGDLVPLVANTLGVIGNGVVGPANGVAWAAQNPNWSRDVLDYAHNAPIQFVQEQKDYFGSHTAAQVLEEAKNGFIAAATNPRTLELGIAVCLTYGAAVKVGEFSNAGPGLNGKTFDTAVEGAGTKLLNPPINITDKGLQHIVDRHISTDLFTSKSKFNDGIDVQKLIINSTQSPMIKQANGNFARIVNAGNEIGFDVLSGKTTNTYTVITNTTGD